MNEQTEYTNTNTTTIQHYDILLRDELAVLALEYIKLDKKANYGLWFNQSKQKRYIALAKKAWYALERETNMMYPEFIGKPKMFYNEGNSRERQFAFMRVGRF